MTPVQLNIVCFRYRGASPDRLNARIVIDLQESGIAAPSTTLLDGRLATRAAIVNHRTEARDIDALLAKTIALGEDYEKGRRALTAGSDGPGFAPFPTPPSCPGDSA